MSDQPRLTRTCSSCGLEKPLAAFLQISKQGTHYGTICASCRAAQHTAKPTTPISDEDSTTETTDKRIGAKEKVQLEEEKIRQHKDLKELYIKAAKKRDEENSSKIELANEKEKAEKDHRKFYIETKQNFLSQKKPDDIKTINIKEEETKQLEKTKAQAENQQKIETYKQEDIIKQEIQITSLDFSNPFIAGQTSQFRFQTDTFLKFKSWLGGNPPVVKTLDLLYQKNVPAQAIKNPVFESSIKTAKENIEEYIEKRLENSPSSTRRR